MTIPLLINLLVLLAITVPAHAQLVTYQLINGAAGDQAGHIVQGTITLDPACGSACTGADIDSFEYTISGPMGTTMGSSIPFGTLLINARGKFVATPTALTFDFALPDFVTFDETALDMTGLSFVTNPSGNFYSFTESNTVWWEANPSGVVTIATAIPEPSGAWYLGLLLAGYSVVAHCQRRRCRAAT